MKHVLPLDRVRGLISTDRGLTAPEEFPVVFTVFLGGGVYRLARRKALVNRAVAVENVGRISCICSDKTGTITEGRLRVARVIPANGHAESTALAMASGAVAVLPVALSRHALARKRTSHV